MYTKVVQLSIVLLMMCILQAPAAEKAEKSILSPILFAHAPGEGWDKEAYGLKGEIKPCMEMTTPEASYLLYGDKEEHLYLSCFINGEERRISAWDDFYAIVTGLNPELPKLFACDLDGKGPLDIVYTYTVNMAGGKRSYRWQTYMLVVFNNDPKTAQTLKLGSVDYWWELEEPDKVYPIEENSQSYVEAAFAVVLPATASYEKESRIVIWRNKQKVTLLHGVDSVRPDKGNSFTRTEYEFSGGKLSVRDQDNLSISDYFLERSSHPIVIRINSLPRTCVP